MFTLKTPARIVWEITGQCNRQCSFCYSGINNHSSYNLPVEGKKCILAEILASNPLHVVLTGGEPLVEKDTLIFAMQELHKNGIYTQLCTNGDLIDASMAEQISANCDIITLPIMGGEAATHDRFMGEGSWANINRSLGFVANVPVELSFLLTKENYHELGALLKWYSQYANIKFVTLQTYVHGQNGLGEDLALTRSEQEEIMMEIVDLTQEYADHFLVRLSEETAEIKSLLEDRQFNYQLFIKSDGEVLVNQWVKISGGNLFKTSLAEIWCNSLSSFWSKPETKEMFKNFRNVNNQGITYDSD